MKKKKQSFREKLSASFGSYMPLFCLVMLSANLYVIYSHERDRKPVIKYMIATNTISRVDAPPVGTAPLTSPAGFGGAVPTGGALPVDTNLVDGIHKARNVYRMPYRYFIHDGCPHVQMYDRYYSLGSPTSRGIIVRIFPDAIILKDGSRIENLESPNIDHALDQPQKKMEVSHVDR